MSTDNSALDDQHGASRDGGHTCNDCDCARGSVGTVKGDDKTEKLGSKVNSGTLADK